MNVKIEKSRICGRINAPPSKSMAHRLLICAALCEGESVIDGIADSQDILATIDCITALGAKCDKRDGKIHIRGISARDISNSTPLGCRESASTLRFFIPLCLLSGKEHTLTGTKTLMSRPLSVYEKICNEQRLSFKRMSDTELCVKGALTGGCYKVDGNISSQFISGLLFALPLCERDSTLSIIPPIESRSYMDLTIQALARFGVKIEWADERTLFIKGNQKYRATDISVEGDYSNCAFFSALSLFDGNEVEIAGLDENSLQGDRVYTKFFDMLSKGTPTIHIGNCPDLGPILMAVAAAKNGAVFSGTHRLKIKESDRGAAMAQELSKFGTKVKVYDDEIVVYPTEFHAPSEPLISHNDHRIVMSLAVLSLLTGGEIQGAEAVKKSLPDFFEMIKAIGGEVTLHD